MPRAIVRREITQINTIHSAHTLMRSDRFGAITDSGVGAYKAAVGCLIPHRAFSTPCAGTVRREKYEARSVRRMTSLTVHHPTIHGDIRCDVSSIQTGRIFRTSTSGAPDRSILFHHDSQFFQSQSTIVIAPASAVIDHYIVRGQFVTAPQGNSKAPLLFSMFHHIPCAEGGEGAFARQCRHHLLLLSFHPTLETDGKPTRGAKCLPFASGRLVPWKQLRPHQSAVDVLVSTLEGLQTTCPHRSKSGHRSASQEGAVCRLSGDVWTALSQNGLLAPADLFPDGRVRSPPIRAARPALTTTPFVHPLYKGTADPMIVRASASRFLVAHLHYPIQQGKGGTSPRPSVCHS